MQLTIYTDGGAIGNPGPAAFAYVIYKDKEIIISHSESIGIATNNIAEYTGLINALEKLKEIFQASNFHPPTSIIIYSDSLLMVNQLNGLFKVKNARIRKMVFVVRTLENEINLPIKYIHIYREKNILADSLVKKALGRN